MCTKLLQNGTQKAHPPTKPPQCVKTTRKIQYTRKLAYSKREVATPARVAKATSALSVTWPGGGNGKRNRVLQLKVLWFRAMFNRTDALGSPIVCQLCVTMFGRPPLFLYWFQRCFAVLLFMSPTKYLMPNVCKIDPKIMQNGTQKATQSRSQNIPIICLRF